jgi:hypothetical protein
MNTTATEAAPTSDEAAVLTLAERLGYWPSYRQVKRLLGFGSDRAGAARNGAEPRWAGAATPNADKRPPRPAPVVIGVTPDDTLSAEERAAMWERAIRESEAHARRVAAKRRQSIELPPEPFALAMLGDTHMGGAGVDYAALLRDAVLVRDTPGMYALFGGDGVDNWIIGKLQALQRDQIMPHDASWAMFLDWLDIIGESLLAVVLGNHDLWSAKLSGFEPVARHLRHAAILYDPHEIVFTLACGEFEQRWLVRHSFRYGSVFNPTHGQEVAWERGGTDFDVVVGFHKHNGTLVRPFMRQGKSRTAVQMGTYKIADEYGRELGMPAPPSLGVAAMVAHPDGRSWWFGDLPSAAEFLSFLRSR